MPPFVSFLRRPVSQGEVLHLFACSRRPVSRGDSSCWFLFAAPGVTGRFLLLVLVRGAWCLHLFACSRRPVSQGDASVCFFFAAPGVTGRSASLVCLFAAIPPVSQGDASIFAVRLRRSV